MIGLVHCTVAPAGTDGGHARFVLPELPKPAGTAAPAAEIAAAIGLAEDDIGFDHLAPMRWAIGNIFTFVPVRSLDAVRRCRVNDARWDAAFEVGGVRSQAYVFCRETPIPGTTFMPACLHCGLASPKIPRPAPPPLRLPDLRRKNSRSAMASTGS